MATTRSQNPYIKPISSRFYLITALDSGLTLDLGPATSGSTPGVFTLQFNPDVDFNGSMVVMGVLFGPASDAAMFPFLPIPYRQITTNNVASDYSMSTAQISGPCLIQVPANALSVGLLVSNVTLGTCAVCSWDMNGSGAV